MMNKHNYEYYQERLKTQKEWNCKLPEAAALLDLIEYSIKNKAYWDYYRFMNTINFQDYDVIVYFNPEPIFGIYLLDDNSEHTIRISTIDGIKEMYL